jgi:hypothetical protein
MRPEARYRSDDRDLPGKDNDLVVFFGDNGDWYVSIVKHGEKIGPSVRVTTSGAARGAEGVAPAVMRLHAALRGDRSVERFLCPDCGLGVKADEDGCCAMCGRDCAIVVVLVEPLDCKPSAVASGGFAAEPEGMSNVDIYLRMVDLLRESRRSKSWQPEHDRPLLAHLEDLYEKLDDAEQNRVEAEGWRGWPEQYDARMRALADLEEFETEEQHGDKSS